MVIEPQRRVGFFCSVLFILKYHVLGTQQSPLEAPSGPKDAIALHMLKTSQVK